MAQISRAIARALSLNEDLAEAIALGHDLGHTPFGHVGERVLDKLCPFGFEHNVQSLRVVDVIEKDGRGLNLTAEVRDGILQHKSSGHPATLEGAAVSLADRIAYINHDIEDAIRAGILREEDLPQAAVKRLGHATRERINTVITDIYTHSAGTNGVNMSEEVAGAMFELRSFMFKNIYSLTNKSMQERAERMLTAMYAYFLDHFERLPGQYLRLGRKRAERTDRLRLSLGHDGQVCDKRFRGAVYPRDLYAGRGDGMSGGRGIDPRYMQELKQKNNIVEVIGSYVPLERKGGNYWACCPFHHEKTPSFAVNEADQFYHCFGCGVSGDVVGFVREIESTDFLGAVRILADRAKMPMPESNFDTERAAALKKKRDSLIAILLDSARFYLSNLYGGGAAAHLEYISRRKLAPTTVKKFGLGASLDFYSLPEYLAGKGVFGGRTFWTAARSPKTRAGGHRFAGGRLIFLIINAFDEVVGFGGRLLEKSDFAKYKNTKETAVFNKSKTLYNVNLLKRLKREQTISEVIVVEGYMDTISLYQAGFKNVVASMGTSLTKDQARLVKRYTENVYISYDGDFAGQKADLRGLEILKDENLNVRVVPLPEGLDPDDVAKQGAEAYQKCLDAAMPLIDYKRIPSSGNTTSKRRRTSVPSSRRR